MARILALLAAMRLKRSSLVTVVRGLVMLTAVTTIAVAGLVAFALLEPGDTPPLRPAPAMAAPPPTSAPTATPIQAVFRPRPVLSSAPVPPAPAVSAASVTPTSAPTALPTLQPKSADDTVWFKTTRETGLWSGPDEAAKEFVKAPAGITIVAIQTVGRRTLGFFNGDRQGRQAGEVWIDSADLQPVTWPRYIRGRMPTVLRAEPSLDAASMAELPTGTYLEVLEPAGRWARVFYLGDGRTVEPVEGWVEAAAFALPIAPQETIASVVLTRAMLLQASPDIWLRVPYLSQLDGSSYAEANCGPTTVSMILEFFGRPQPQGQIRAAVLEMQGTPRCDSCGVRIEHLASITEERGLRTYGLRPEDDKEKDKFRRWTMEEIRAQLRAGRVVVPQVMFRFLPGRGSSPYWGDHYIVLTGFIGDKFIYNDPIDSDGSGFGRLISTEALDKAMETSDFPYAAFAVGR